MADDILKEALEAFDLIADSECDQENKREYKDDIEFALLEKQWPEAIRRDRELDGRPCLTINKLPPFIRQVVNEARQNKPGIVVHPVDSEADPETADVMNGLIRNIEQSSNAEVAYDTALECAVAGGFGYFRINTAYAFDDTFDQDIVIERIANPLSVYGDIYSTAADSSDWNNAFITDTLSKDEFQARFKGAQTVDWDTDYHEGWLDGDNVTIAEYWRRDEVVRNILALSDGQVIRETDYEASKDLFDALGVTVVGQPREVRSHKVTQYLMSGAEILDTVEWKGRYIPIVPVYGTEVNLEGKRYWRSMIRGAKDAQRMFNYWRTTSTELVALAPKAPYIGRKGAFETDAARWATANSQSHAYLEYDGPDAPQRQPFSGIPAGALQEALNASDDMKAIVGLYDPSLGARSNETSGKAIMARQQEGDVSTFHFIDNLSRAIRHAGRIILDLIPQVYSVPRVLRVIAPDGTPGMVNVAPKDQQPPQPMQMQGEGQQAQDVSRIFDLTTGKYDLTVKAGPSFASQREAFLSAASDLMRAVPQLAPILAKPIVENFDLPNADEILEKMEAAEQAAKGPNPEQVKEAIGKLQQQGQQLAQKLQQTEGALQAAQNDNATKQMEAQVKMAELQLKGRELDIKDRELDIKAADATTKRIQVQQAPELAQQKAAATASHAAE